MHVGFITKALTSDELKDKIIYIKKEDRVIFPQGIFFIDSYDETYGVYIDEAGFVHGLKEWFNKFPGLKKGDFVIIAKHSTGFSLSTTSPAIKSQIVMLLEMNRIMMLTDQDILCPNCYYTLERVKLPKDSPHLLKLKCPRCGFILLKTKIA